jgi:integrase
VATFRKRKGRWQAIIRRVDLKATKTFDRLVDAKAWATAKEREADLGGVVPGKMTGTLAQVITRYEKEMWPVKRWGQNKALELNILRRDLGAKLLTTITQQSLLAYARGLKISPGGISSRLSYLKEVLRTARDLWKVSVPVEEVQKAIEAAKRNKIAGKSGARTRRPTEEELLIIRAYAQNQQRAFIDLDAIVEVLSVLPLRVGELVGIEWADLIESRRSVIIRGRKHPDILEKEKNDQEVPLINFKGVDTYKLIADRPRYMDRPFPYKRASISSAFWDVAARCKIPDLHIHDLRAYSLSRLLEAGVPIPQVALISGHRNWKVLAKHYARIDPASVHETLKRLA